MFDAAVLRLHIACGEGGRDRSRSGAIRLDLILKQVL